MNTQQRIIVVLLVLAILFSVASIFISFSVFTGLGPEQTSSSSDGSSADVQLFVESSRVDSSGGVGNG